MSAEAMTPSAELDALFERLDVLAGRQRTVSKLVGGLTNANYRVQTDDGGDYVVRASDPHSGLAIDRENERYNTGVAGDAGVGAKVIETLPEENVTVVAFLQGKTLEIEDVRNPELLPRIADAVRGLHELSPFKGTFDMRDLRRGYLKTVLDNGYRVPDEYLELAPIVEALEDAMAPGNEPPVPCNNDLLPGNFIDAGDHIWLIDYDYSGMNEASFELGNLASEAFLAPDRVRLLVASYWRRESEQKYARAQAWSMLSRFGWPLWASIQASTSSIDFDFWTWGMEKYDSVREDLSGERYQETLHALVERD